jgi:hypothetical protein
MALLGNLRKSLFGGLPPEINALRQMQTKAAPHLGKIVFTVIQSYQATLKDSRFTALLPRLSAVEVDVRGFAYEGAAMALMQLDCMLPWKKRLQAFLAGPASPYVYPAYVGAGLALARIGKEPEPFLDRLDPVLRWYLIDGYGWRYGIFSRKSAVEEKTVPDHLSAYGRRVFDQGLGRSLWFSTGADVDRVVSTINSFPEARQADLWSGVGFACAYAGGADRADVERLPKVASAYTSQLALGAALGAKGRQRGGNLAPHTDLACEVLCGLSGNMAAAQTDIALQNLPTIEQEQAFETWRKRIEAAFVLSVARVP